MSPSGPGASTPSRSSCVRVRSSAPRAPAWRIATASSFSSATFFFSATCAWWDFEGGSGLGWRGWLRKVQQGASLGGMLRHLAFGVPPSQLGLEDRLLVV
jgi:hypothetical protein